MKRKRMNDDPNPKGIERPKNAAVNYLPTFPFRETGGTLEEERVVLLAEMKKKNNDEIAGAEM